jgi:hypothetical protein
MELHTTRRAHMADQRVASTEERQEIAQFLGNYWGMNEPEEIEDISESANILVLDHYMSDGPGYMGPIFFVVFGGGPEFHLVLIRHEGQLERITSEFPEAAKVAPDLTEHFVHDPGCTGPPCDCLPDPPLTPDDKCPRCGEFALEWMGPKEDMVLICDDCHAGYQDKPTHDKDEDCEGTIVDDCCTICGVGHGDPCQECSSTGYHREGCSLSDASYQ